MERVVMEVLKGLNLYDKKKQKSSLPSKLRDSKLSETVEDLACRMQKGTILSQSRDELDVENKTDG
jgi:hypothetical protein